MFGSGSIKAIGNSITIKSDIRYGLDTISGFFSAITF